MGGSGGLAPRDDNAVFYDTILYETTRYDFDAKRDDSDSEKPMTSKRDDSDSEKTMTSKRMNPTVTAKKPVTSKRDDSDSEKTMTSKRMNASDFETNEPLSHADRSADFGCDRGCVA